jgi:hypothetical protein
MLTQDQINKKGFLLLPRKHAYARSVIANQTVIQAEAQARANVVKANGES